MYHKHILVDLYFYLYAKFMFAHKVRL